MTPFVKFKIQPTNNINSSSVVIFGKAANTTLTSLVDSILLTNLTQNVIVVSLSFFRASKYYILANQVSIEAYGNVDVLVGSTLTFEPGDMLYASSNYSSNVFNSFVSYRELTGN